MCYRKRCCIAIKPVKYEKKVKDAVGQFLLVEQVSEISDRRAVYLSNAP